MCPGIFPTATRHAAYHISQRSARMLAKHPLTTLLAIATAGVDAVVLSLEHSLLAHDTVIALGTAHLGLLAIGVVNWQQHLFVRIVALSAGVLVVVSAYTFWRSTQVESGRFWTLALAFAYWAVMAMVVVVGVNVFVHTTNKKEPKAGRGERQFRLSHLLSLTTFVAILLGFSRPLVGEADVWTYAFYGGSSAILCVAYFCQKKFRSAASRVSLTLGFSLVLAWVLSAIGTVEYFIMAPIWIALCLVQAVFYVVWLEVTRHDFSRALNIEAFADQ